MRFGAVLCHWFFPATCCGCDLTTSQVKNGLCPACRFKLTALCPWTPRCCSVCGAASAATPCVECRHIENPPFDSLRTALPHNGLAQRLVAAFKYAGRRDLVTDLASALLSLPQPPWQWHHIDGLIAVPMHVSRFRERPYDQVYLLALALQCLLRRELEIRLPLMPGVICVGRPTRHQAGMSRLQRLNNLHGAFHCSKRLPSHIRTVLVLDDVLTTGATLREVCKTLRKTYPKITLHAAALTRTPKPVEQIQANSL